MRFIVFIFADLLGTLLYIGLNVSLGWVIGKTAVDVAEAISHYALWVIIGSLVLIFAWSFWSAWRQQQRRA